MRPEGTRPSRVYEVLPLPEGEWWTLDAVRLVFGFGPKRLYNLLCELREQLGPPTYRIGSRGRLNRLLSGGDVAVLRGIVRVRVWRRPSYQSAGKYCGNPRGNTA